MGEWGLGAKWSLSQSRLVDLFVNDFLIKLAIGKFVPVKVVLFHFGKDPAFGDIEQTSCNLMTI